MGKLVGGPFGQLSGKTGDLVGSSWKGISTIKRYQPNVSNPRTAGQVAQRGKMANIVAFSQSILAVVIKPLWDRFQSGMSGYNAFVSRNIDLFNAAMPSDFEKLITSSGKMASTEITDPEANVLDKAVHYSWVDDSGQGFKLASDRAYLVVINQTKSTVEGFQSGAVRGDTVDNVVLTGNVSNGDVLHLYLSFLRSDGSIVSVNSHTAVTAVL